MLKRSLLATLAVQLILAGAIALSPGFRVRSINAAIWFVARAQPQRLAETQRSLDAWVPANTLLLAGDSFAAMLPASSLERPTVNFALGGATTADVRQHLRSLNSLHSARALVLIVGSNDVLHRPLAAAEGDLRGLLSDLPATLPVILCTIPPIDPFTHRERTPEAIAAFNRRWTVVAASRPHTHLVRVENALADAHGFLRDDVQQHDGLHLNATGNRQLATALRAAIARIKS